MEIKSITTGQLMEMFLRKQGFALIDVREDYEVAEGMIPGAKHIRMDDIPYRLYELTKVNEYYIICRSGARSLRVCEYLNQYGYNVTNVAGGMNAWFGNKVYPS